MVQKYNMDYIKDLYKCNPGAFKVIPFWKPTQTYGIFSQWWKCTFTDGTNVYNSAEQYMMYQKAILFKDYDIASKILLESDPSKIKNYGRLIKFFDNDIWDKNKYDIVYNGNYLKFSQNKTLLNTILSTKNYILVESSIYDSIWGIGIAYNDKNINNPLKWPANAQNLLGLILMQVRDDLTK